VAVIDIMGLVGQLILFGWKRRLCLGVRFIQVMLVVGMDELRVEGVSMDE